jgi:hypothetical protein
MVLMKILHLGQLPGVLGTGKGRKKDPRTFRQKSLAVPPEEKAIFHEVTGAGKSHVLRRFFELSEADCTAITEQVDRGLADALSRI